MAENNWDLEELDTSLHNLSLEDEDEVDLGCTPLTSTPKKDSSGKHALTPNSKRQNEPSSKKLNTSESPSSVSEYSGDCVKL
ncbi:Hypothetical predicted protein [Paramuricea clavata]|uniref:Uncharacterized protein n=1 Tax=Paramuricea clavata TaxID=317549 RepID=A0A7D9JCT9_PARCT|nr:Hypothetical predicted protein [Paramuricea clavata]